VQGIWLENLEENVFLRACQNLHSFSHIQGFAVPNCNVMLLAGRTRRRTAVRRLFTETLSAFTQLVRLDLSQNCFAGCLPEILDALPRPLEYLCLRECDLLDSDIHYLSTSRHAASIKQLNVSKICGLFPEDNFAVETGVLVRCLQKFTSLQILHMQQNQITDSKIAQVCQSICSDWSHLKALNISDNIFSSESALRIVEACVHCSSLQNLKIPYSHNLFDAINMMENGRQQFSRRVREILERNKRTDIDVEVFCVAYAVLANI
jgi:Ran GTPase-activating protein (RanGAP) involved in mRNA processing and transport